MAMNTLFSLISEKMEYLTQRQAIIAQNIAQASTPNYKPKDVISFDKVLQKTHGSALGTTHGFRLATTNPKHVGGGFSNSGGSIQTEKQRDSYEVKPSGNAVVLEQQMSKLSDTTGQYMMMTGLYKKAMGLFKTALGRGGA